MYSRYHGGAEREIRVPENYGGSAFADAPRDTTWTSPPRAIEVAKPSPPTVEPPREQIAPEGVAVASPASEPELQDAVALESCETPPSLLKKSRPLESIGFEELLILGLILLLSENGADAETLLWLGLLLLWG